MGEELRKKAEEIENEIADEEEEETAEVEAQDIDEALEIAAGLKKPGITADELAELKAQQEELEKRALEKLKDEIKGYKEGVDEQVAKLAALVESNEKKFAELLDAITEKKPEEPQKPDDVQAGESGRARRSWHSDEFINRHKKV